MDENPIIRRRPLPPELLCEMHKFLPLADAINLLVNVPSRAIAKNCGPRMSRVVQQIKKKLRTYIRTLFDPAANEPIENGEENEFTDERDILYEGLEIDHPIQWEPALDALIRYGAWLTPTRRFIIEDEGNFVFEFPENFVQDLIVHLANSRSIENALEFAEINLESAKFPPFLRPLLDAKNGPILGPNFIEPIKLEVGNGKIVQIEAAEYSNWNELTLILVNKIEPKKWFEICLSGYEDEDGTKIEHIRKMSFNIIPPLNEFIERECCGPGWSGPVFF